MILYSESDKRIIVRGEINGLPACMLVDTGAVAGILSKDIAKKFGLQVNKGKKFKLQGAGGDFDACLCETPLMLGGRPIYQFLVADISNLVDSIRKETGVEIAGIISLPQMRGLNIRINTHANYITID